MSHIENNDNANVTKLDAVVASVIETAAAETAAADAAPVENGFAALGLADDLVADVARQGITTPTPIQAQAIPVILEGHDLLASAQTGTGKTAAFLLPAIQKLAKPAVHHSRGPRVLVLTPTRELAEQVAKVATQFVRRIPRCKVVAVVGGVPYPVQHKQLAQPFEVLVATPGRLMDLMRGGRIDFRRLELLVLDEADRMLDMGFIDDINTIVAELPAERQTALFSATLSETIQRFALPMMRDPKKVELAATGTPTESVEQSIHFADGYEHKQKLTEALIKAAPGTQAIVFTATKVDADSVADYLRMQSVRADALHGDLQQRVRTKVLNRLRHNEIDVIVATDVAARGIDVAGIGLVINFDLPKFAEDYVHRIGRTGRAGREGRAVSLVGKNDFHLLTKIRRRYNIAPATLAVEGLEARFNPSDRGPREGGGFRGGRSGGFGGGQRDGGGYRGNRDGQSRGGFGGGRSEGGYQGARPEGQRDFNRDGERSFKPREDRGNFGGERSFGGDRPQRSERPFGDRGQQRSFGDRSFGDRNGGERSFGDRAAGGERSFGDRGNGAERNSGDRGNRSFGGGDRPQRSFGDREQRGERSFADRAPRSFGEGQRERSFGNREGGSGERRFGGEQRREGGFGERREGGFGQGERTRSFGDRAERGQPSGERPARKFR
ncbi:Superfamily II DNA and RNA helicase [Andreprevotia lacus DSM 23236]|jgi:superfamily II DNA/RNA helicase|uniref:Superfamily II DNA and RNA helicase n=1 Tax=Andreprevotia lacus DSM 23236 TaxID=1121001 RepID=A0A1W1XIU0_9NEIS|nr:DEAD/DEAH box helicase [Andreprevotia lacus]SMC23747.1 Superfamily II DNA and RNA helicase [Andreprevotia lacus DSM 23236]